MTMAEQAMSIDPTRSGVGMTRVEYVGQYTAPVSFIGKSTRTMYTFANDTANKFQWVADADLPWFLSMSDFRRARDTFDPLAVAVAKPAEVLQPVTTEAISAALIAAQPIAPRTVQEQEQVETVPKKGPGRRKGSRNKGPSDE